MFLWRNKKNIYLIPTLLSRPIGYVSISSFCTVICFFLHSSLFLSFLSSATVLSTSLGKTFFAWHFILNENILFWLTIFYQKPFVFSVSVFCSLMSTLKFNLRPKIGLTYAISIVKWVCFFCFVFFIWENILYFSLLNSNYWCFTTVLWKFQKNWTSRTCWKSASKCLLYRILHNLHSFLQWRKVIILDFLKAND